MWYTRFEALLPSMKHLHLQALKTQVPIDAILLTVVDLQHNLPDDMFVFVFTGVRRISIFLELLAFNLE
jgi:hypothetical protein